MPESTNVPVPTLASALPLIVPLTVVERLLLPTTSWFAPRTKLPAPAIEPAEMMLLLARPVVALKSKLVPALALSCAVPAVLLPRNETVPAVRLMIALPADDALSNWSSEESTLKVGAFDELLTMPSPLKRTPNPPSGRTCRPARRH